MAELVYSGGYDGAIAKMQETTKNAINADLTVKDGFSKIESLDGLGEKLTTLTQQAGATITSATSAVVESLELVSKVLAEANDAYIRLNEGGY